MEKILKNLNNLDYSIVFFIPALKINFYISQFKKYLPDRKILIAKEMTKMYEKFIRGNVRSIKDLPAGFKGELTVVVSKKENKKNAKNIMTESVKMEIVEMLKKYSHKDVVDFVVKKENLSKRFVYDYCLKMKK